MNEIEFKKHFRLSRDTYNILLTELGPSLKYRQRSTGKPALTPDKQLLVFLWYMANKDSMRELHAYLQLVHLVFTGVFAEHQRRCVISFCENLLFGQIMMLRNKYLMLYTSLVVYQIVLD